MTTKIPTDLKYAKSHEWAKKQPDGTVLIGITDHAQAALGDLVFVEVPKAGRKVTAGEACAVVESVKAASDVYAPISGEVVDANATLANAPETLNQDPYGKGWMFKVKPSNAAELDQLLDAAGYGKVVAEAH
jgi:glycine cleavage system H protein